MSVIEEKLIDKVWPHVWPLIQKANELTMLESEEDILNDLKSGSRSLVIVGDGVAVIRDCGKFLEICYVAGENLKEWWPTMSQAITTAAEKLGRENIVAFGRAGWKRHAPDFEPTETRMYIKRVA